MIQAGVILTANDSEAKFALGTEYKHYNGNTYRYVKLLNETAAVTGVAGDLVAYIGSPSSTENFTVVTDCTDAATKPIAAGALTTSVTGALATAEYIWVQTQGACTVNQTIAGTPADGDGLFLSTTDKTLTLSTAADDPVCAYATDESAKKVFLLCP